ncbi:MAG: enoyl-CoA hydratase/isomerase family protein [Candidatus Rokubacteria bacterium]|nr:enoyl-CoA hydratase/isomerase family protein [Candidatus Rokubacteria bacterium]
MSTVAGTNVLYTVQQGVARITLNRPHLLNPLNTALAAELADAAEAAARDPGVWVVEVRGAGASFCSGMDRTALSIGEIGEAFFRHWIRALNCLEDMGKPVLAVKHGDCLGGGLQLALACDFRLAAQDAILGLGATRHGLIPDGAVLRLARVVGIGRAKELALLNDNISAEAARALGLVNWVVAPAALEATVDEILEKCLHAAPTAVRHTKRLLHESFHVDPREVIEEVVEAQRECMASWEIALANRAWDEKREARFYPPPEGNDLPGDS